MCEEVALGLQLTLGRADNLVGAASFLTQQLSSGSFLQDILAAANKGPEVFRLFSAHDDSLRSLLFALFDEDDYMHWPPYAAHLSFEVWTASTGKRYVNAQYDGAVRQLRAPCSSPYCEWSAFEALLRMYLPPSGACGAPTLNHCSP